MDAFIDSPTARRNESKVVPPLKYCKYRSSTRELKSKASWCLFSQVSPEGCASGFSKLSIASHASKHIFVKLVCVSHPSSAGIDRDDSSNSSSLVRVGSGTEVDSAVMRSSEPRSIELKTSR